jgi:hypothetical protein
MFVTLQKYMSDDKNELAHELECTVLFPYIGQARHHSNKQFQCREKKFAPKTQTKTKFQV